VGLLQCVALSLLLLLVGNEERQENQNSELEHTAVSSVVVPSDSMIEGSNGNDNDGSGGEHSHKGHRARREVQDYFRAAEEDAAGDLQDSILIRTPVPINKKGHVVGWNNYAGDSRVQ
jgi:hypothetical protein